MGVDWVGREREKRGDRPALRTHARIIERDEKWIVPESSATSGTVGSSLMMSSEPVRMPAASARGMEAMNLSFQWPDFEV